MSNETWILIITAGASLVNTYVRVRTYLIESSKLRPPDCDAPILLAPVIKSFAVFAVLNLAALGYAATRPVNRLSLFLVTIGIATFAFQAATLVAMYLFILVIRFDRNAYTLLVQDQKEFFQSATTTVAEICRTSEQSRTDVKEFLGQARERLDSRLKNRKLPK